MSKKTEMEHQDAPKPAIDLSRFCGKGDPRNYLNAPYQENGHAMATNGHIGIVVWNAGAGLADVGPAMAEKLLTLIHKADAYTQEIEIVLPTDPPATCRRCEGSGWVIEDECQECDGDGWFSHGNHEYDCKGCDGRGEHLTPCQADAKDAKPCHECSGTGMQSRYVDLQVNGTPYKFQEKYLRLIQSLPGYRLLVSDDTQAIARFEFDGGVGALMPCRF